MRRCLMAKDLVRHPGSIGIKSPPDRSVSLPDPRDTAVSMMGFGDDWQPGDIPDATEGGYTPAPGYELPPHPWPPLQPLPGDPPPITSNGHGESMPPNTAAMVAEGEPGRIGRAHPERPSAPYEPLPELTEEERKRAQDAIDKIREENEGVLNPESRMDAQFLSELFAHMAEQENRGYFGDVGEFVGSMSTEQKIALLIAVGVLTAGASTPMLGPALAGGAGLAFANQ